MAGKARTIDILAESLHGCEVVGQGSAGRGDDCGASAEQRVAREERAVGREADGVDRVARGCENREPPSRGHDEIPFRERHRANGQLGQCRIDRDVELGGQRRRGLGVVRMLVGEHDRRRASEHTDGGQVLVEWRPGVDHNRPVRLPPGEHPRVRSGERQQPRVVRSHEMHALGRKDRRLLGDR